METMLAIFMGMGLSAACGFRVFVPLFLVSLGASTGHVELGDGFQWMGTRSAFLAFGTASICEIAAYYIPWLDHLLDTMASPSSVVAGSLLTAAFLPEMSPFLKWCLAAMVGGSLAASVQTASVFVRNTSGISTAGMANPVVSTIELVGAIITSFLAVLTPVMSLIFLVVLLSWLADKIFKRRSQLTA